MVNQPAQPVPDKVAPRVKRSEGRDHLIPQAEFDRVAACFVQPISVEDVAGSVWLPPADAPVAFLKWLDRKSVV